MRTEDQFLRVAQAHGIKLERQITFTGLTGKGHEEAALDGRLADPAIRALREAHTVLGGDGPRLRSKRSMPLRLDFYDVEARAFIEIDEVQHFTTDRGRTLDLYPNGSAPDEYWSFVERWRTKADGYRAAKPAADFPGAGGRRAQRAWLDMVRDLGTAALGLKLVRVPAPECDATIAFERYLTLRGG